MPKVISKWGGGPRPLSRHINLIWNLGWLWVLKVQQMEVHSTYLMVSSPEVLFKYAQIILFFKSHHFGTCYHLIFQYITKYNWDIIIFHHFGTCFHLIFLYIIGYILRPLWPCPIHFKIWGGCDHPIHLRIDAYAIDFTSSSISSFNAKFNSSFSYFTPSTFYFTSYCTRDVNTGILANWFSVAKNWFQTGFNSLHRNLNVKPS